MLVRAALVLSFVSWTSHPAQSTTFVVQPGGSTIATAMAGAAIGDTLLLEPGTYFMNAAVPVRPGVTVISRDGPRVTIIDMEFSFRPAFEVFNASPAPRIEGLTITHGSEVSRIIGGGVYSQNSDTYIANNLFVANAVTGFDGDGGNGSAIGIVGGSPVVQHNTIVANRSAGGAISLAAGTTALIRYNVIAYNQLSEKHPRLGWGIICSPESNSRIEENLFWHNVPADYNAPCVVLPSSGNVNLDPLFCSPRFGDGVDGFTGDWRVQETSPVAPSGSLSGWGAPLGTCGSTPSRQTTWGALKVSYR